MNCRGIVIRCGEHVAHTTLPHFLLVIVSICFVKTRFVPAICKLLAHSGVYAQLVKTWTARPTRKGVASLPAMVPPKEKCKGSLAHRTLRDIAIRLPWWQDNIALPSDRRSVGMWWDGWCGRKRSQRGRRGIQDDGVHTGVAHALRVHPYTRWPPHRRVSCRQASLAVRAARGRRVCTRRGAAGERVSHGRGVCASFVGCSGVELAGRLLLVNIGFGTVSQEVHPRFGVLRQEMRRHNSL